MCLLYGAGGGKVPCRERARASSLDELGEQPVELLLRLTREARVDRPGLHDRARGRDEPVKALAGRQGGDRAAARIAVGDVLDRLQERADLRGLALGGERGEQRLVEVRPRAEEPQRAAEEDDAGVDGLAALDARDDSQRGVLERLAARHGP